jgi:SAM-dependent methyltransferase
VYSFLKSFVRAVLPERLFYKAEPFLRKVISVFYSGNKYECPVCGFHASKFIAVHGGESHLCPRCGSIERKRLLWLYLLNEIKIREKNNFHVLHFSPSTALRRKFEAMKNIEYHPTDIFNPLIKNRFDITQLPFSENYFDLIVCYHVLEHVTEDRKAMQELFRVLKRGGVALLQVPFSENETLEDFSVTSPEERKKLFGQEDHVRYYGRRDFVSRLQQAGFKVEEIKYAETLGEEKIRLYLLDREEIIFRCEKT